MKTSRAPWAIGIVLLAGALSAAGVVAYQRFVRTARPELPAQAAAKMAEGREALLADDEASLERAVATFSDASALAPGHPGPQAWQALSTSLLGATLAAEVEDLAEEAEWIEQRLRLVREVGPADLDEQVLLLEARQGDVGARLGAIEERSRRLLADGRRLALSARSSEGSQDDPDTVRAMAIVQALEGAPLEVDKLVSSLDEAARQDPWLLFARGRARLAAGLSGQIVSDVRADLEKALAANPGLLRASWQLGRLAMLSRPSDLDAASVHFDTVLVSSARHEGAKRGVRLLEDLRAPLPVPADLAAATGQ